MIPAEHIRKLAEEGLEGSNLYVTGVRVSPLNQVTVFIDGDEGVKIGDCVNLSRVIESKLDRDREDYSLDVSSHGASAPLVMPRQYRRHVGREFDLKLKDGSRLGGKLTDWRPEAITLEWQEREDKQIGKGKVTVTKSRSVSFDEITEGKIRLKF
jgi:ribosome maturation factor RimP